MKNAYFLASASSHMVFYNEEQIVAFLAEIGNPIRNELKSRKFFKEKSDFLNITTSVLMYTCPYCGDKISIQKTNEYFNAGSFRCQYCKIQINNKDLKKYSLQDLNKNFFS